MKEFPEHFEFMVTSGQLLSIHIYLAIAGAIAFFLTLKSSTKYKIELFFLSFYLLSGNLSIILTIKIPGFSFFELQPLRLLYLMLLFFILRKTLFSRRKLGNVDTGKMAWFEVALFGYVLFLTLSIFFTVFPEEFRNIIDAIAFLIIMIALRLMADQPSYNLIGTSIMIAAVISSSVSLIQFTVDPYFLRIGDNRAAFGNFIRANGIFSTEYFNSYFLIVAVTWTFVSVKNVLWRTLLISLFTLGVISSFQRMSWIILALVFLIYLVYIHKIAIERLVFVGLSGLALILSISIFYYQDIMNSTMVTERLSDSVGGREGYYSMVLDNFGKKPLLGYGNLKNEIYYENLLRITQDRDRATATTGDLHSGYFSVLFLYGVPAFVCFVAFVVLSVLFYAKSLNRDPYFIIPFLVSIIYLVGNLTNTFLFLKYISVLYAIHIGIGMGVKKIKEQIYSEEI